jgi:ketosteroid isomerase-like protein
MTRRIAIAAVPIALASLSAATPESEIQAAEKQWATAVKGKDLSALEKIFTPGLIYAHSTGIIEDKATYINRLKTGKQRYDDIQFENMKVVAYGDSAVSHSIARTIGQNDRGPFNNRVMMIHYWVKQGGTWRLAAHQTTQMP